MTLERASDAGLTAADSRSGENPRAQDRLADIGRVSAVFSIVYGIVYFVCVGANLGPIGYYPLTGEIHLTPQPAAAGPAMMWYGWMINSTLAGAAVSALVLLGPRRWADRIAARGAWLVTGTTLVLFLAFGYLLRAFFFR